MKIRNSLILFATLLIMNSCNNFTVIEPEKTGYLQIDNYRIYYEVFGQGEPIVLIHAGVTDSRMWNFQINDLSKNFEVIRFDQRGFGKSSFPDKSYDPILDIIALLDTCKIEKANFIGISLGALQTIDLAINYPERVKSIVISGASFIDWQLPKDILDKHIEFSTYVAMNGPDSAISRIFTDPFWKESIPDKQYKEGRKLFEQILTENKQSFTVNWQFRELSLGLVEKLYLISCPVLMFKPENEMSYLIPLSDTIESKINEIEIAKVSKTSHLLNMEKPNEFNRKVINFLKKN